MLAFLVALSGTAYAAIKLPANSVGTKQIKNGAVTLTKISASAQQGLKPRAWAVVKADGTILASSGITGTVGHHYTGIYDLTLAHSAANCAAVATNNPDVGSYTTGGVAQAYISTTTIEVEMQYFNGTDFSLSDESFSVVVYC
jgi:hypothetical protein